MNCSFTGSLLLLALSHFGLFHNHLIGSSVAQGCPNQSHKSDFLSYQVDSLLVSLGEAVDLFECLKISLDWSLRRTE